VVKVAVTGATGFVGRHVVAELLHRGVRPVLVLRPGSTAPAPSPGLEVVYVDVGSAPGRVFERLGRPDTLIHLAWGGLPNYRSLHHVETELPAHYRFLKSLVESGLGAMLVTGTCSEYGMCHGPLHEGLACSPDHPYGLAKDSLRRQLLMLKRQSEFALTWARLFYLHGDGQSQNSLLPQLRSAAERGETHFPMSGGEQLRDYLSVDKAAEMLVSLALARRDHGIVNICSGQPVAVRSLVERWIAENSWSLTPELGRYPYPDYEPFAFWGDAAKLRHCLAEQ
jgi:nucleoside-diphosphate-sugar epimerase